ncbi:hypothetical protein DCC81_17685 [Chitinophaga parva]|uniref:DUF2281 domain-containing protein n=1 Tax=Chitinophaga parva TaxID=2169414 RepID=A0A2T7BIJ4_9BACT|nr:DUF2281 domain-containing protein [Chitinophaga parva]PUZ26073.1 hypothetical protein DCC81_17685 [Chitinophaga parva]
MTNKALVEKIASLPAPLKEQVIKFVDFLLATNISPYASREASTTVNDSGAQWGVSNPLDLILSFWSQQQRQEAGASTDAANIRPAGLAKGLIKMAQDFDTTPDDFKDYM